MLALSAVWSLVSAGVYQKLEIVNVRKSCLYEVEVGVEWGNVTTKHGLLVAELLGKEQSVVDRVWAAMEEEQGSRKFLLESKGEESEEWYVRVYAVLDKKDGDSVEVAELGDKKNVSDVMLLEEEETDSDSDSECGEYEADNEELEEEEDHVEGGGSFDSMYARVGHGKTRWHKTVRSFGKSDDRLGEMAYNSAPPARASSAAVGGIFVGAIVSAVIAIAAAAFYLIYKRILKKPSVVSKETANTETPTAMGVELKENLL